MRTKSTLRYAPQAARMGGLTLLELMIVVVIVGILASIAYPSFQEQLRSTRRAEGKATLLQTAQALERCYTRFSVYNNGGCGVTFPTPSPDGHYAITSVTLTAAAFTLAATPQGPQTSDAKCGVLRLTSTGIQGSRGALTDTNSCW